MPIWNRKPRAVSPQPAPALPPPSPPCIRNPPADPAQIQILSRICLQDPAENPALPPPYAALAPVPPRSAIHPRPDEGAESLPFYAPAIYKEGPAMRKPELLSPYLPATQRAWTPVYLQLNNTQLNVYSIIPKKGAPSLPPALPPRSDTTFDLSSSPHGPAPLLAHLLRNRSFPIITNSSPTHETPSHAADIAQGLQIGPNHTLGRLVKSYTLQYAEVGGALDYSKRICVLRLRAEAEQFLIQLESVFDCVTWANAIQMGIDVALPLDERPLPKQKLLPRRNRRNRRRQRVAAAANPDSPSTDAPAASQPCLPSSIQAQTTLNGRAIAAATAAATGIVVAQQPRRNRLNSISSLLSQSSAQESDSSASHAPRPSRFTRLVQKIQPRSASFSEPRAGAPSAASALPQRPRAESQPPAPSAASLPHPQKPSHPVTQPQPPTTSPASGDAQAASHAATTSRSAKLSPAPLGDPTTAPALPAKMTKLPRQSIFLVHDDGHQIQNTAQNDASQPTASSLSSPPPIIPSSSASTGSSGSSAYSATDLSHSLTPLSSPDSPPLTSSVHPNLSACPPFLTSPAILHAPVPHQPSHLLHHSQFSDDETPEEDESYGLEDIVNRYGSTESSSGASSYELDDDELSLINAYSRISPTSSATTNNHPPSSSFNPFSLPTIPGTPILPDSLSPLLRPTSSSTTPLDLETPTVERAAFLTPDDDSLTALLLSAGLAKGPMLTAPATVTNTRAPTPELSSAPSSTPHSAHTPSISGAGESSTTPLTASSNSSTASALDKPRQPAPGHPSTLAARRAPAADETEEDDEGYVDDDDDLDDDLANHPASSLRRPSAASSRPPAPAPQGPRRPSVHEFLAYNLDLGDDEGFDPLAKWEPKHPHESLKLIFRCLQSLPAHAPWIDKMVIVDGQKYIVRPESLLKVPLNY